MVNRTQTNICYCCLHDFPVGEMHEGTMTYTGRLRGVVQHVLVCTACRHLGCDVMNPTGCKRPEAAGAFSPPC